MNLKLIATYFIGISMLYSCSTENDSIENIALQPPVYPSIAIDKHPKILTTIPNGIILNNGGYGSSMAQDPIDKSIFYLLTDRGPNVPEAATGSIMIATPSFVPQIGKFRLRGDSLTLESVILLKNSSAVNLNGLPNPANAGATGEKPYDINNNPLLPSEDGIDSEGMALALMEVFGLAMNMDHILFMLTKPVKL